MTRCLTLQPPSGQRDDVVLSPLLVTFLRDMEYTPTGRYIHNRELIFRVFFYFFFAINPA